MYVNFFHYASFHLYTYHGCNHPFKMISWMLLVSIQIAHLSSIFPLKIGMFTELL